MVGSSILTLQLVLVAAIGSMLIASTLVWSMQFLSDRWRNVGIVALAIAAGIPLYVHTSGWEATWGKFGWLPAIQTGTRNWAMSGFLATAWIHAMVGAAGGSLIVYYGYVKLARGLLESASLEAGPTRLWFRIALPLLRPTILLAGSWSALLVATDMTVADLYSLRTLPDLVYQQFAIEPTLWPAIGATLISFSLLATMLFVVPRLTRWDRSASAPLASGIGSWRMQAVSRQQSFLAAIVFGLLISGLLGVPLTGLVIKAGWEFQLNEEAAAINISLSRALTSVAQAFLLFREEIFWSGCLAGLVALIGLPIALACSQIASRSPNQKRLIVISLGALAVLPGPVFAIGIVWVFSTEWFSFGHFLYDRTLLPTALAALPRPLAVGTAVLYTSRSMNPRALQDMIALDGPAWLLRIRRVDFPMRLNALAIAGLLMLLLTVGDLSASLLVAPPGVQTVAARLFGLLHSGVRQQEAGLCLITVTLEAGLVSLALLLFRRRPSAVSSFHPAPIHPIE